MTVKEYFGLEPSAESIYKYAPVYVHNIDNVKVIIKRTKPQIERLEILNKWQKHLNNNGIKTVEPIEFKNKLHHRINEENWVVYPFIEGEHYTATSGEIHGAGDFLGRMHAASSKIFEHGFKWDRYDDEFYDDVKSDLEGIKETYAHLTDKPEYKRLTDKLHILHRNRGADLTKTALPAVDATWDYKASNIIYSSDGITVVDTDNAGHVPRLFDLALALLLFHTDASGAPGRVFTPEEWKGFLSGYEKHVTLTDVEKALWQDFLLFVYMDEVLWAISDLEDDEPRRQVEFMESLVSFDIEAYGL